MNDNDYVIFIDENGQPYIAHSVFTKARDAAKSAARSAHKYIARIGDRYFYTQEELKAFYNRGKAAAGKAAEAVRGAATKAATTAKSAASSVSKYASDRLGDVSDFVHRRNKVKSPGTSSTTDREIDKGNSDRRDPQSEGNRTPYEARHQKLVQDILDAQDALGKVSRYSEEGHRAEEDLARAWRRLGDFFDNMSKGPIDDKYKVGKLTKKK